MGWDIVAIGTNHNLPVGDPIQTADRISQLVKFPISVGYYEDWLYNHKDNSIRSSNEYKWIEIAKINPQKECPEISFSIEHYCARKLYSEHHAQIGSNINFINTKEREWFISNATEELFALYECDSTTRPYFDLRIFKEIVEFTEDFPGRWFQFVHALKNAHTHPYKDNLRDFRQQIFRQLKICGCDKAFYFADQGPGLWLFDAIDKSSKDWVSYLIEGEYIEDGKPKIFDIPHILNGSIVLSEDEWIDCLIDDFSDFEK